MASYSLVASYLDQVKQEAKSLYKALLARDARFDGLFFVGVTSTDIYCRPVCPVKTPKEQNCQFYKTQQEAELAGFRPCLRCRPELAPGNAPMDRSQRIAQAMIRRIEEGMADETTAVETIANEFEMSSRQMRRVVQKELGAPPIQLILTRRLLLAKQLLTETKFPVTEVAFASGFSSLRRFNDAFATRYGMAPTRLRKNATEDADATNGAGTSTLLLSYRPPYDWNGMLAFLKARELKGAEWVMENFYARTVQLGDRKGWIKVTQGKNANTLTVEFTNSLAPVLPALLNRVRDLFDLTARPEIISAQLAKDAFLRPLVKANPGLRVPGAFDGFELAMRAILGQQITVKAATTIAGRLIADLAEPIVTPFAELNRLTPAPVTIAKASVDRLAKLGIISARCRSICAMAEAHLSGAVSLNSGNHQDPETAIARLAELPGVGPWTANYIAMRALRWPDAFPKEDIVIRNRLGGVTAKRADEISQAWRPWRSYATLHIWRMPLPALPKPDGA